MDWRTGAASRTDTQSKATGGKGTQQLLDSTYSTTRLAYYSNNSLCMQINTGMLKCLFFATWTVVISSYIYYLLHLTALSESAQQMPMAIVQCSIQQSEFGSDEVQSWTSVDF